MKHRNCLRKFIRNFLELRNFGIRVAKVMWLLRFNTVIYVYLTFNFPKFEFSSWTLNHVCIVAERLFSNLIFATKNTISLFFKSYIISITEYYFTYLIIDSLLQLQISMRIFLQQIKGLLQDIGFGVWGIHRQMSNIVIYYFFFEKTMFIIQPYVLR